MKIMKVDNRYCQAFIGDLKSCTEWNFRLGAMNEESKILAMEAIDVLEKIYSNMPEKVIYPCFLPY